MIHVGRHCILELYGCSAELLNDEQGLIAALRSSAEGAGATWMGQVSHKFQPQGVTALGLLSESHISIHTWPEVGYAAVDVFTCGDAADPRVACDLLIKALKPEGHSLRTLNRAAGRPDAQVGREPSEQLATSGA